MCCILCGHCWGISGREDGTFVVFVKILNFSVCDNDVDTQTFTNYDRWAVLPVRFNLWSDDEEINYNAQVCRS